MTAPTEPPLRSRASEPESDPLVLEPGELVDGLFEVRRTLGEGGMGAVYEAYDRDLDRTVALKLHRAVARESVLVRMRAEARAMARVVHPNVLTVHAVGLHRGSLYIAMEFAAAGSLRRWQRERRSSAEIIEVFAAAGRGLAAAHRAGIVHRDFKPDNVLLDDRGVAKVADFGLANEIVADQQPTLPEADELHTTRRSLTLAGTPAYMPPEQLRGERLDARADQFAFCSSLFEALCGALPFAIAPLETLADRIDAGTFERELSREVPAALRGVVRRGLSARPEDRFADMDELVDAMREAADAPRRRRARWLGIGALALTGAALGLSFALLRPPATEPVDPCTSAAAAIDEIWTSERADSLAAAYANTPHGGEIWALVRGSLDGYTAAWKRARAQTCVAGLREGATASAVAGEACLDSARRDLAVLLDRLELVDADALAHAVEWAHGLARPADCLDRDRLAALAARPADPATRARLEQLEDAMHRLRRDLDESGNASSTELARTLVARAQELGHEPTQAWATRLLGSALERDGDIEGARAADRDAFNHAIAGGDWREAMLDALDIAAAHGRYETELERADEWLATARALEPRVNDLELSAVLASTSAVVAAARGDLDRADAGFAEAIALQRAADPDHPALGKYLANAGIAALRRGDTTRARPLLEEALATTTRILGDSHPDLANRLIQLGSLELLESKPLAARDRFVAALELVRDRRLEAVVEYQLLSRLHVTEARLGDTQAAREYARAAFERAADVYPADHPSVFQARVNWIEAVHQDGDPERAATLMEEAIAGRDPDDPTLARAYLVLSTIHAALGDHAAAIVDASRAIERNRDPQWTARCYYARAEAHAHAEHPRLALADFESGFAAQPEATTQAAYHAARETYATLLAAVPGRRDEAVEIAREALEFFSNEDSRDPEMVESISAWLASVE